LAWGYRASSFGATASINFSTTLAVGAAVSAGDRIVAEVLVRKNGSTPATPSITDSVNGATAYTEDTFTTFNDGANQCRASVFSLANSGAGTPTLTVVSSGGNGGVMVAAYSGLLASDPGTDKATATSGVGVSTAASSGATAATTAANELVVGVYFDSGWDDTTWNPTLAAAQGSGYTNRGTHRTDPNNYQGLLEDKDSGATGAQTANLVSIANAGSVTWGMLCAVYKLAGAGGGFDPSTVPWSVQLPEATSVAVVGF
jgi:hypothetical protein